MTTPPQIVEAQCNRCLVCTKHEVKGTAVNEHVEIVEDQLAYRERTRSELLQCRGCGHVCMRQTYEFSGAPGPEIEQYPPPISRRKPQWLSGLSFLWGETETTLEQLFAEVYSALFAKNYRLAAMGTRAIIDVVLTDKLGDIGGFERKLDEAVTRGLIGENHRAILMTAVDAGSAAAHRAFKPDPTHLSTVLDIVEHTVQLLYVLESSAEELAGKTPKRRINTTADSCDPCPDVPARSRRPFVPPTE